MSAAQERFSRGVAVVTGSGAGIGEGFARRLAEYGMDVVVTDVEIDRAEQVAASVRDAGGSATAHHVDVSDADSVERLAADVFARHGRVDLLISNAGVEVAGRLWDVDPVRWRRIIGVNVDGAYHCVRAFVPRMIEQGSRGIVGIVSSTGGVTALAHQAAYVASKHAALSLTECLLLDVEAAGADLQVSAIMPNWVRSRLYEDAGSAHIEDAHSRQTFEDMAKAMATAGMDPLDAATEMLEGVARGDFWVMTDAERVHQLMAQRAAMLIDRTLPAPPIPRSAEPVAAATGVRS